MALGGKPRAVRRCVRFMGNLEFAPPCENSQKFTSLSSLCPFPPILTRIPLHSDLRTTHTQTLPISARIPPPIELAAITLQGFPILSNFCTVPSNLTFNYANFKEI